MESWFEIKQAEDEGRHELHLNGDKVSDRLSKSDGQLPNGLFTLKGLNFLEISETSLDHIPSEIKEFENMLNLALHRNAIETLASEIGSLGKLKFLDLSFNKLASIPEAVFQIASLHTVNLGNNELTSLPDAGNMKGVGKLFIDHNRLSSLPSGISEMANLSELYAQGNDISDIDVGMGKLQALKVLDLSSNKLHQLPRDLPNCSKLKEVDFKSNPLKDNRLKKMVNQCAAKSILDYIAQHADNTGKKGGKGKKKGGNKNEEKEPVAAPVIDQRMIHIVFIEDDDRRLIVKQSVTDIRPYIVCTIIKNLDLSEPVMFKKFLSIQTKLHENECDMRTKATIATHKLKTLKFPLYYEATAPDMVEIKPLGKSEKVTSSELIENLKEEREQLKQKKKRQPKTGLFKFIELVDGKEELCCLRDAENCVISFPPITNCEDTKVSPTIDDVFIEVTSPISLPFCKSIMDALIQQLFLSNFRSQCSKKETEEESTVKLNGLVLEQFRVTDHEYNMKVVYPSSVDLNDENVLVSRVKDLKLAD